MTTSWDHKHATATDTPCSCSLLQHNKKMLPATGMALDIACGRGGNTIELAKCGLTVTACDSSKVAIDILNKRAQQTGFGDRIKTVTADAATMLQKNMCKYDLILVSKFLDKSIIQGITASLKQHGLIYYQTFTEDSGTGPTNKNYRLKRNELLCLFKSSDYLIVHYHEYGIVKDTHSMAELIAKKK